ncbi:MAG: stage V sporulation protein S [Lachnospirales bacterium]
MEILKVSASSQPKSVAGAIAAILRNNDNVEIQTIGAGAVNQAVKAVAIARGFVAPNGIDVVCIPAFTQSEISGELKTGIKLDVIRR